MIKLLGIALDDIDLKYTAVDNDKVIVSTKEGGSLTINGTADVTFEIGDGSTWIAERDKKQFTRK